MGEVTNNIVSKTAYLIGIADTTLLEKYPTCSDIIIAMMKSKAATKIRSLCILRTNLLMNFEKTDTALKYDFKRFEQMDWFDANAMAYLKNTGIEIHIPNGKNTDYLVFINKLISENINACAEFYPDWIEWDYMKDLFVCPNCNKPNEQKKQIKAYQTHRDEYPNKMYIHWKPHDVGDLLASDTKFLKTVYGMHGRHFTMNDYCNNTNAKMSLTDFITARNTVDLVVDCENSDVYKLYAMLMSLDQRTIKKIHKIILFDDEHTTMGWDFLKNYIDVNIIEHIVVKRVMAEKSLVDIRMAMGIGQEYYQQGITSFVLVSSDSDFWGVMSSLPGAKFYCVTEDEKFSKTMSDLLDANGIAHCTLDDFNATEANALKETVLLNVFNRYATENIFTEVNGMDLMHRLYSMTRITATNEEKMCFYNNHIQKIRIKMNSSNVLQLAN